TRDPYASPPASRCARAVRCGRLTGDGGRGAASRATAAATREHVTIVVGVDGSGRSHRLGELAAAATPPVVHLDGAASDLADRLAAAREAGAVVVVDDAHRLTERTLTALADAARGGVRMMISRRPTVDRPALAVLDEAVAGQGA